MERMPLEQENYNIGDRNTCDKLNSKRRTFYKNILNIHGTSQIITPYTQLSKIPSLKNQIICNTLDKINLTEIHKQYCKIQKELQRDMKKVKCVFFESQMNKNMG